jgi:hypothetical protein
MDLRPLDKKLKLIRGALSAEYNRSILGGDY